MGIDYVIDHRCEPKTLFTSDGIVERLKAKARANAIMKQLRDRGDRRPAYEVTFKVRLETPDSAPTIQEVNLQSLLVRAAALDAQAPACTDCAANVAGRPFGCVGYVSYPIVAQAEAWLLDRLPTRADTTTGRLLRKAFEDFGWSGAHAKSLRASGRLFEAADAPRRRFDDGFEISGDQIFEILFGLGHLEPSHCQMLALFFGVEPQAIDDEPSRQPQLGGVLQAVAAAAALRCRLLISA